MAQGKHKRFYKSKAWLDTRRYALDRCHHICELQGCKEPAYIVHHITWIDNTNVDDVDITLNVNNLMCLCLDCHNKVHLNSKNQIKQEFDSKGNLIKTIEKENNVNQNWLKLLREQKDPRNTL